MVSERCRGLNLLNHLQQTNKLKNLEITYNMVDINRELFWECELSFNKGGEKKTYKHREIRRVLSLTNLIYKIEDDLRGEL